MASILTERATDGRGDRRIGAHATAGNVSVSFVASFAMTTVLSRQVPREYIPFKAFLLVNVLKWREYNISILLTTQWPTSVRRDFLLIGWATAQHTDGVVVRTFTEIGIEL